MPWIAGDRRRFDEFANKTGHSRDNSNAGERQYRNSRFRFFMEEPQGAPSARGGSIATAATTVSLPPRYGSL
jgi:hypothetical protein